VLQRVLCPVLISRDAELGTLEDALLASNRGEARFVMLEGEAGMGKTRLTTELAKRARKLGMEVLSGGCSEAEFALPYLPFLEALGNYLSSTDITVLTDTLGHAGTELAQLFPQFGEQGAAIGDPAQSKLRLFEAIVALLTIPARRHGVLLLIEDVHWADAATREVLDHLARRITGLRVLLVVTFRSDELDRTHPLLPVLQSWRRSAVGERVALDRLTPAAVADMIAAILDEDEVSEAFAVMMHERSEGNPFVLEEMLREAIDRGDLYRADGHWERKELRDIQVPESVRDTILLRVGRLAPAEVDVLRAASVLGRTFAYATLLSVSDAAESVVQSALTSALTQQLIEEEAVAGRYRWRHALTQEAIYTDIVMPRRQGIHGRAADALRVAGAPEVDIALHLLGASRFTEAVPSCLASADAACGASAWTEAVGMYERALPHVVDAAERAQIRCEMGKAYLFTGETGRGAELVSDGIAQLDALGLEFESAKARVMLGRAQWERNDPTAADTYRAALQILEREPSCPELALVYMRLAGIAAFHYDGETAQTMAERAVQIATELGADFERMMSQLSLALARAVAGRVEDGMALSSATIAESLAKGYAFIAANGTYNDAYLRMHLMLPGLRRAREEAELAGLPMSNVRTVRSFVHLVMGELRDAEREGVAALGLFEQNGFLKGAIRMRIHLARIAFELGDTEGAAALLPGAENRFELQDLTYTAPATVPCW
jgi:hypothetical protein